MLCSAFREIAFVWDILHPSRATHISEEGNVDILNTYIIGAIMQQTLGSNVNDANLDVDCPWSKSPHV